MNSPTPNISACRDCKREVSADAVTCPHCGAPRPARSEWNGEGYEWKTGATWMGVPLVHIAFGIGRDGKVRTARGIVAIGQRAIGVVACGIVSAGVFSFGIVSLGVVSLGVVSIAAILAAGVNAIGLYAFGVTAIGFVAGGVEAVGWKTW